VAGDIKQESGSEHNVVGQCRSPCKISQCQSLRVKMVYDLAYGFVLWGQQKMGPVENEACETMMMDIFALAQVVGGSAAQEQWCCGSSNECSASSRRGLNQKTNHCAQVMALVVS
jgi:hypothetical protein